MEPAFGSVRWAEKRDGLQRGLSMRVKWENPRCVGGQQFGVLLGLCQEDEGNVLVVVRPDGYGLMVKLIHPSKVTFTNPAEEELYKP